MLKSHQKTKITIVIDKQLASWVIEKAEKENRSINNFIETVLLEKRNEELVKCISK